MKVVLCHVQSHWLSLVPALERFQYGEESTGPKLLLVEMPKNDKT